jgi:hypothetical protein
VFLIKCIKVIGEKKKGDDFSLTKGSNCLRIDDLDRFDLIYFDAFGYRVQPE